MKLHLNATLRTALIAAITAVGMAMPQMFAESKALTVNPTEKTSGNVNISWTGGDTTLNSWLLTFDLKVTDSSAQNFFAISTNGSSAANGWDLGVNGTNLLLGYNGTGSPVVTLTDAYTLNTAQAVTFQFVRDVDEDGVSLGSGTFTVTANGQTGTYKVTSLTDTALVSGSKAHIWTNSGKQQLTNITLTQLDDHAVVTPTSVWTGTDGNNTWEAGNFDPAFVAGGNVKFTADGFDTVVVNSAVSAGKMSVEGAAYTFEIEDGGSLTAAKANIADGASLTVVGGGTATITSLSGAGDLSVGEAGTATVNGLNSYTGVLGVTDGGTLNLGSNVTLSELTVADGTVTTQHASGSGVVTNTLSIGEGGTFKVIGSHDAFGYNNGATKEIVMQGREDAHATLALEQNSTNSVTMTTNIAMHGYSDITVKEGGKGFNTYGGNITVDGVENTIAVIDLRNAVSISVAGEGSLSVGKFTRNGTNTGAVTKTGAGIMTITEASTLPGALNINEGTVQFTAGTSTLDALNVASDGKLEISGPDTDVTVGGTANTLSSTIHVNAATLHLNGTYAIDGNISDMTISYSGGQDSHNGFRTSSGKIVVYKAEADGTVEIGEGAQITRDGVDVKDQLENGVYTASEETDYTNFYVNTGTEKVSKAYSEHTPTAFTLAENTKLDVDQNVTATVAGSGATSVVNIATGRELAGTAQNVKLAGSGTYDLGSTASLGTGTTLGEDWMGVVSLSNLTKADGNSAWISGLANENSWVEFSNFTGFDRAWASSFVPAVTANIILTDDGEHHAAWNLTACASSTYTMVLSGDVKGDGTFKTSGGTNKQSQAIEFQGDISDWEGAFVADADGMRRVVFTGEASTVKARIAKQGAGALNLVVGNGSDPFDAVFHEEVSVTSVEVNANASATFLGQLTTSTVTNAGSVVFNTLEGLSQTITNSGEVIFNSGFEVSGFQVTAGEFGFYDTEGNFSVDGNGYAGTSDSYITIVNGGSVYADEITVTQDGTDYTMNNSGRALADDGGVTDEYTFHVNTGTVSTSEIDGGTATSVEVAGGTLNVDQTTGLDITVTGDATVTGEALDVAAIGIEGGATAYFGDKLEMSDGGVEFQAAEGGSVGVYNDGDTKAYDLDNRDMEVSAHSIVKTTGEDATVSNWLYVDKIVNVQDAKLTLDGLGDAVSVKNITVGQEGIVEILDHESGQEATVTVTEELAAGNGTLLANLVFEDNSALLVEGVQKSLSIGSVLTMNTNIQLDEATLRALDNMEIGDTFWLIGAVDGKPMEYTGEYGEEAGYDSVFSRIAYGEGNYTLLGNFNIAFNETDGFGLQRLGSVPEPATGTLSLLALMALAARRRRKH